jgi:hypothetical protein
MSLLCAELPADASSRMKGTILLNAAAHAASLRINNAGSLRCGCLYYGTAPPLESL